MSEKTIASNSNSRQEQKVNGRPSNAASLTDFAPPDPEPSTEHKAKGLEFQFSPAPKAQREYVLIPTDTYDGWFRRGGVHIVGGPSGAGKSTLIIDLLYQQSIGNPYFGHSINQLGFLVIFADRPRGAVDESLERMGMKDKVAAEYMDVCWGAEAAAKILTLIEWHNLPPIVFVEGADLLVEDPLKPSRRL